MSKKSRLKQVEAPPAESPPEELTPEEPTPEIPQEPEAPPAELTPEEQVETPESPQEPEAPPAEPTPEEAPEYTQVTIADIWSILGTGLSYQVRRQIIELLVSQVKLTTIGEGSRRTMDAEVTFAIDPDAVCLSYTDTLAATPTSIRPPTCTTRTAMPSPSPSRT